MQEAVLASFYNAHAATAVRTGLRREDEVPLRNAHASVRRLCMLYEKTLSCQVQVRSMNMCPLSACLRPNPALQMRLWFHTRKWCVLWLVLSALTLLHVAALVYATAAQPLALICAALFCWSGLLGGVAATRALLARCPQPAAPGPAPAMRWAGLRVRGRICR